MQMLKSPIIVVSLFAVSIGMFFLIGGVQTGIAQIVVPVSLAFTTICVLGGFVNREIAVLKKRIEMLEDARRRSAGETSDLN